MIINERCNGQQTTFCLFSFPGGASGREPTCNVGDGGDEGQQALRKARQPTPVFMPGESHGPRSLAGYSSWGHKESDTTEVT